MARLKVVVVISLVLNLVLAIWFLAYSSGQEEQKDIISTTERANLINFKWRVYQILNDRDPGQRQELMEECEFNPDEDPADLEDAAVMEHYDELLKQKKIKQEEVIRVPTRGAQPGD